MRGFKWLTSLRGQLAVLLTLALLPLGLISLSQTWNVMRDASYAAKSSLIARTTAAASEEVEKIERALGAASALSVAVRGADLSQCRELMASFVAAEEAYLFAGLIPLSGLMACSSAGGTVDFSAYPSFETALTRGDPFVEINPSGAVTGAPVMIVNHPVRAPQTGALEGFLSISFPHQLDHTLDLATDAQTGFELITLNADGTVLASTDKTEGVSGHLPEGVSMEELFARSGTTFYGEAKNGDMRLFAVNTLVNEAVLFVGSWPRQTNASILATSSVIIPLLFPALMWLAGMIVGFYGVERLVLRHTRQLNSAIRRFALGTPDDAPLQLHSAPEELQDAARAFNRMALIVTDAARRREQDLFDKEVLLREVHHRVKNNLQLIASIMNMHARTAKHAETHAVLAGLQRRLRSMAMLHRSLYTSTEMTTVDAAELIRSLVDETQELAQAQSKDVTVTTDLDPVALYPDQAVPLTMLLAELLTNAAKYVGRPANGPAELRIAFKDAGEERLVLEVYNTLSMDLTEDEDPRLGSTGVGSGLARAFISQLEGEQVIEDNETGYRVEIRFDRADFSDEDAA